MLKKKKTHSSYTPKAYGQTRVPVNARTSPSLKGRTETRVNFCEEVMPGLALNQIKEFTKEINEKERSLVLEEGGGVGEDPEAWEAAEQNGTSVTMEVVREDWGSRRRSDPEGLCGSR